MVTKNMVIPTSRAQGGYPRCASGVLSMSHGTCQEEQHWADMMLG